MLVRCLVIFVAWVVSHTAVAQGQTYAVIIGISDYEALTYRSGDLRFADRDARQMVTFLRSKQGGNVPVSHIRLLTNRQATRANIQRALTVFQQAKAGDRVILYFSGHGLSDSFVPFDVKANSVTSLLTHRDIKSAFHASKATTKLCVADACMSGGMTRPQADSKIVARTLAGRVSDGSNVAMLLASRSTESAVEARRLEGGVFTHYLLQGLNGRADHNADGIVSIRELHQYVSPLVRKMTRGRQAPVFYGRFSDNLALAYL
ncbi:caspase family protein [Fibrisoma limi]|nr:caspase family protein [Fibrisoma limi]